MLFKIIQTHFLLRCHFDHIKVTHSRQTLNCAPEPKGKFLADAPLHIPAHISTLTCSTLKCQRTTTTPRFSKKQTSQQSFDLEKHLKSCDYWCICHCVVIVLQPAVNWVVSAADRERYDELFKQTDTDGDGLVNGTEVIEIFMQSSLSQTMLAQIWWGGNSTTPRMCWPFIKKQIKMSRFRFSFYSGQLQCSTNLCFFPFVPE